jgi:hypothetical protein
MDIPTLPTLPTTSSLVPLIGPEPETQKHKHLASRGWHSYLTEHGLLVGKNAYIHDIGLFETYTGVASRTTVQTKYHDSHRFLGLCTDYYPGAWLHEICANFDVDLSDRYSLGFQKEWRTKQDKGSDALIYLNCGPLNAYTCYQVWSKFSGNSMKRPVLMHWTMNTNLSDENADKFTFPQLEKTVGKYHYSWKKMKITAGFTYGNNKWYKSNNNILLGHMTWDPTFSTEMWYPMRQAISNKVAPQYEKIVGLQLHQHTITDPRDRTKDLVDVYVCTKACTRGNGNRLDNANIHIPISSTHGLKEIEFKNLCSTLHTLSPEYRAERVTSLIHAALSNRMFGKELQDYATFVLRYISEIERSRVNMNCLMAMCGPKKNMPRIQMSPAIDLYFEGDVSRLAGYRKSKGLPMAEQGKNAKRCICCFGWAPDKYKWVKSYCVNCRKIMESQTTTSTQREATQNLYWSGEEITQFDTPILLAPVTPYYKPKPMRENLNIEDQFGQGIGWKRSTRPMLTKTSQPSQLIGTTVATLARVFDFNADVEIETLKTRAFAKPLTEGLETQYNALFDFLIRNSVLGEKDIYKKKGAIPFCIPDFLPGGYVHTDLKNLGLLKNANTMTILQIVEDNLNFLNEQAWLIPTETWQQITSPAETWIGTFDARRRRKYWDALIKYKQEVQPKRLYFDSFLKRELAAHGCNEKGIRRPANPRIIFDPVAWSQIVMGPILRSTTNLLHEIMSKDSNITYFGGMKPNEGNEWLKRFVDEETLDFKADLGTRPGFVAIENDFSKMDSCYGNACFKFVEKVYLHWGLPLDLPLPKTIFQLWMTPKSRFRSGTRVRAPSMNASGRADTALMNALINGYVQLSAYMCESLNTKIEDVTSGQYQAFLENFYIGLLGDDSVTFTLPFPNIGNRVSDHIALYGFEARDMKTWVHPKFITFLGQRVYPVLNGKEKTIAWGPSIGRKLFKLGVACDIQDAPLQWLKQNMVAVTRTSPHVPIISDVANKTLELLQHVNHDEFMVQKAIEEKWAYKRAMLSNDVLKADWSRMSRHLEDIYDFDISKYIKLLGDLDLVKKPTIILNHHWIHRMVELDTGG